MFISREEFLKREEEKQERMNSYDPNAPKIGFFALKNDGDEAIVRFCYKDMDEFDIISTHQANVNGKFRRVNCIRDFSDPIDECPMCAAKNPIQQRFYIKLIEYTRAEDGSITSNAKIWERPTSYVGIMSNLFAEYGDIQSCVFKIKRSGKAGDKATNYSIMLANPSIYNEDLYPKDENAFDGYKVIGHAVLDKNTEELKELLGEVSQDASPKPTSAAPRKAIY